MPLQEWHPMAFTMVLHVERSASFRWFRYDYPYIPFLYMFPYFSILSLGLCAYIGIHLWISDCEQT